MSKRKSLSCSLKQMMKVCENWEWAIWRWIVSFPSKTWVTHMLSLGISLQVWSSIMLYTPVHVNEIAAPESCMDCHCRAVPSKSCCKTCVLMIALPIHLNLHYLKRALVVYRIRVFIQFWGRVWLWVLNSDLLLMLGSMRGFSPCMWLWCLPCIWSVGSIVRMSQTRLASIHRVVMRVAAGWRVSHHGLVVAVPVWAILVRVLPRASVSGWVSWDAVVAG